MNFSWKTLFISFTLLLGMLSPMLAQGSCNQGDLKGTWYTYGMVADSYYSYTTATITCKIVVNSSGVIVASNSSCRMVHPYGSSKVPVKGGDIVVNNQNICEIKGQIKVKAEFGYTYAATKIKFTGTLASDKRTYYATGYVHDFPAIVTHLTGAKK